MWREDERRRIRKSGQRNVQSEAGDSNKKSWQRTCERLAKSFKPKLGFQLVSTAVYIQVKQSYNANLLNLQSSRARWYELRLKNAKRVADCEFYADEICLPFLGLQALNFASRVGVDDMVMLTDISNSGIAANLKKRYEKDQIYVRLLSPTHIHTKNPPHEATLSARGNLRMPKGY